MRRNRRPHEGDQVWQLGFKSSPGSTSDGALWKGRRRKRARNLEREGDDETRAGRLRKRWVEILGIRSTAGITKNSTDGNTISRTPLTRSLMDWEADPKKSPYSTESWREGKHAREPKWHGRQNENSQYVSTGHDNWLRNDRIHKVSLREKKSREWGRWAIWRNKGWEFLEFKADIIFELKKQSPE